VFGLIVLVGCGVYTLIDHKTLEGGSPDWQIPIPFTGKVHLKSEGDAGPVLRSDPWVNQLSVQVIQPNDSSLAPGRVVSWKDFQDAETRAREAGKTPPTWELVMDQYELHRFQKEFRENWVKIDNAADLPLKYMRGQVIPKSTFDEEVAKLKSENRLLPTHVAPELPYGTTQYAGLTILPSVRFTLPLLLAALALWMAFRVVNLPVFADFLIATEAEVNKVSWTSRSRLIQDTIVVLVTVILTTLLLLAVDSAWFYLLSWDRIKVLQVDKTRTTQEQKEKPY
jgi:preprotein translocase SecE subunit